MDIPAPCALVAAAIMAAQPAQKPPTVASYYEDDEFVATGAKYRPDGLTAAHRTLPFGTKLTVCRHRRCVVVTVNDRGPATWTGCEIDLSRGAARIIGIYPDIGVDAVRIRPYPPTPRQRPRVSQ